MRLICSFSFSTLDLSLRKPRTSSSSLAYFSLRVARLDFGLVKAVEASRFLYPFGIRGRAEDGPPRAPRRTEVFLMLALARTLGVLALTLGTTFPTGLRLGAAAFPLLLCFLGNN